ncbi:TMEM165/GDT1 family protein [Haloglycomyces albus]|uniref:TMEM165/GDT1 family protein n=1 Tax=Haloglycomyces albus TaxID=526067 RepID=UPI00046D4DB7
MIDITAAAVVFGLIFIAEIPDKTTLAGLMLSTRFRPIYVFLGAAAAFVVHVILAVSAGSLLTLLPQQLLSIVVAALFLIGAVTLFFHKDDDEADAADETKTPTGKSFWKVAGMSFSIILVAEFGDMSQLMMASFTAHYGHPLSVALGAVLALWTVAALGIMGGRTLVKFVPIGVLTKIGAGAMALLAAYNLYEAFT